MAVMLSPSELDGEVDHSFFDSDSDDGGEDRRKKAEKGLEAEKQSPAAHERSSAKDAGKGGVDLPPRTQSKTRHSKQVELSKKSRTSNVSSVSYTADKTISNSTDGEGELNLHSKRPSGMFLALVADAQELEDVYSQSPKETKVKAFSANSKKWKEQSLRKPVKSQHPHNLSPTSTADSESSRSSWRSNMGSPGLPSPIKFSSHCGVKRTSVSSEESQDLSAASTDESDNTVTNVSPLSSHESGLLQSFNQNHAELKMESHIDQQNEESVTSSGLSNIHQEDDSYQDVDERSFSLESQLDHKLVLDRPRWRNRKNYTFSNDEVWRIDRENQRLLGELSRLSPGPRSGRARRKNTSVASNSPVIRISHSALNRQREQRRIEQENLALLKRLESVKPTPGLKRSEQLADYQRQVGYLGAPSHPVYRSSTRNERTSSRTSSFRSQTS